MDAGGRYRIITDDLMPGINVVMMLVAEKILVVLLRPAGVGVLLGGLGRSPLGANLLRLAVLDGRVFVPGVALDGNLDDAGVDDLAFARPKALRVEKGFKTVEQEAG